MSKLDDIREYLDAYREREAALAAVRAANAQIERSEMSMNAIGSRILEDRTATFIVADRDLILTVEPTGVHVRPCVTINRTPSASPAPAPDSLTFSDPVLLTSSGPPSAPGPFTAAVLVPMPPSTES